MTTAPPTSVPRPQTLPTTSDENLSDWDWAFSMRAAGKLNRYTGQHVVLYRGQVVSSDVDALRAIDQACAALGVVVDDLAVVYVDAADAEGPLHAR